MIHCINIINGWPVIIRKLNVKSVITPGFLLGFNPKKLVLA